MPSSGIDIQFPTGPLPSFPRVLLGSEVTIGISAHGNHETTLKALKALFLSVEGDYELILVDDCSPDQTLDLFCKTADYHTNTKIFSFDRNLEYSGSLNTILSHAAGDYVIFISNDILVTPTYIATILNVARHSEEFGIVRGTSNFVDNGLSSHNILPERELDSFEDLFGFSQYISQELGEELVLDPFLTGDAFLVSRKVLDAIGGLDPLFFGYFADHDLGVRARRVGFKLVLARDAYALHLHTANFDYLSEEERVDKMNRRWGRVHENWARFKIKYGLLVERPYDGVRRLDWDGLVRSAVLTDKVYCPPIDYSCHLIADVKGDNIRINGTNLARRARALMMEARLAAASDLCLWGLRHSAGNAETTSALGGVRLYQGFVEEAISCFRSAVEYDPSNLKAYSNLLLALNYSEQITQEEIYSESRRWEVLHGQTTGNATVRTRQEDTRIRLGFVSGDLRRHSISYFLEPLLDALDRSLFEIYCYSDVSSPDEVTECLKKLADHWLDASGYEDVALAEVIRADKVDILVDLAGHTGARIRLPVFCNRPAPIQVSWLGYPNTTGLSSIDYRLTDEIADPCGLADSLYAEKLIRLKDGFLCYRPPEDAPEVGPLPCLKNGFITIGSFNMLPKVSTGAIAVWARLLRRVKDSRLLLKCHYFADHETSERYIDYFADYGITRDRIELRPSVPNTNEHLASYNEIDIALDTFPYNGTTTTCEALWMGVPVVTLAGDRHAGRVGGSILARMGQDDLIAQSNEDYIERAAILSADTVTLENLRNSLRDTMRNSSLCNEVEFTRSMEDVFLTMFKCHCNGEIV